MSGRKRSHVWTFFNEYESDKTKVKCTLCGSILSRGGTGRNASTSALTNHIKQKHKEEADMLQPNKNQPSTSGISSEIHKKQTQQSLENTLMTKWDINDPRSLEFHKAIAEMISCDNQPLSIVEDTGFNRLIKLLKPKYELPSRKYMAEVVIPSLYEKVKAAIKNKLTKAKSVSITTDMWTCMNNLTSFLSFTAHWLDENFTVQHAVLQMAHFTGQHTAHNIQLHLEEMAINWQIDSIIHVIVRDNGPNIVKAINDSPYVGKSCFIHTLQLAINSSLQVQKNVNEALIAAKRIVTHFNHSPQAQEKLVHIQEELNLPQHKLIQDVVTSWNSKFYMCQRLLEQKRAVSLYISDNSSAINIQNLSERQWQILHEVLQLLQPFEEITKLTSCTFSSISEVIPHIKTLLKYLQKVKTKQTCPNVNEMQETLEAELKHRFANIQEDKYYTLATLLDPRFRLNFFSTENIESIKSALFREHIKRSDLESSSDEEERLPLRNVTNMGTRESHDSHSAFWSCYEELASTIQSTIPEESQEPKSQLALELQKYLNETLLQRSMSPFKYMVGKKSRKI